MTVHLRKKHHISPPAPPVRREFQAPGAIPHGACGQSLKEGGGNEARGGGRGLRQLTPEPKPPNPKP